MMSNQNKYKKHGICSVVYTVLSVIALISGGICARALFLLAGSMDTDGALGAVFSSFVVFVLFMIFCISAIALSMLGAGFAVSSIKGNYLKKVNIAILICNIVCFVTGTVLLILILTDQSLRNLPPYV